MMMTFKKEIDDVLVNPKVTRPIVYITFMLWIISVFMSTSLHTAWYISISALIICPFIYSMLMMSAVIGCMAIKRYWKMISIGLIIGLGLFTLEYQYNNTLQRMISNKITIAGKQYEVIKPIPIVGTDRTLGKWDNFCQSLLNSHLTDSQKVEALKYHMCLEEGEI